MISKHWRGVGAEGESLSPIFIVDPGGEDLSERSGLMADLFSTHPPTASRIEALLGMAHMRADDFELAMAPSNRRRPRQLLDEQPATASPAR